MHFVDINRLEADGEGEGNGRGTEGGGEMLGAYQSQWLHRKIHTPLA